jgi:hypothetical protein
MGETVSLLGAGVIAIGPLVFAPWWAAALCIGIGIACVALSRRLDARRRSVRSGRGASIA